MLGKFDKNMQSLQCTASCSSFLIYDPFRIFLPLRGVKSLLKCQIFHKHGNSSRYCNAESLQAKSSLGPKCPIVLVLCSSLGVQAYLNFKEKEVFCVPFFTEDFFGSSPVLL